MRIINLIKCEFIKNFTLKRFIISFLVLLISCFIVNYVTTDLAKNYYGSQYDYEKMTQQQYKNNYDNNPSLDNEFNLIEANAKVESLEKIGGINMDPDDYRMSAALYIGYYSSRIFLINKMLDGVDIPWNNESFHYLKEKLISLSIEELKEEKTIYENDLRLYNAILNERLYYKAIELYEETSISKRGTELYDKPNLFSQFVIKNKIEDYKDWRVIQYRMSSDMESEASTYKSCEENLVSCSKTKFNSESGYKRLIKNAYDKWHGKAQIAIYGAEHNIKSNTAVWGEAYNANDYFTVRHFTDNIFYIIIVVFVLVLSTNSGIISKEINEGSARLLLSSPNKRWKIYLSKYLYLLLDFLILYLLSYVILFVFGALRYGLDDLFIPQLIFNDGKVLEVNYILWFVKTSFIAFIPYISLLAILQFLSSYIKSSGIIVAILLIPTILSLFIFFIIYQTGFTALSYLPTTYMSSGDILFKTEYYLYTLGLINHLEILYVIVPSFYLIVFYFLGTVHYSRKDV